MKQYISYNHIGIIVTFLLTVVIALIFILYIPSKNTSISLEDRHKFKTIDYPTPNFDPDSVNKVVGIILHHTAESTAEDALKILSSPEKKVGAHVVIDKDGTRYVMAKTSVVTYHAGFSILNGREGCNYFTIGIEFQGNTLQSPLTEEQIASGIEYILPLIDEYNISLKNIVTHQMVRTAYKQKYPEQNCRGKVDITTIEYKRFMKALRKAIDDYRKKENT